MQFSVTDRLHGRCALMQHFPVRQQSGTLIRYVVKPLGADLADMARPRTQASAQLCHKPAEEPQKKPPVVNFCPTLLDLSLTTILWLTSPLA